MATNLTRRGASANNPARLPALPAAQQVADPVARDLFELIREWLEVRLGARGDFYERAVTHRELKAQLDQLQTTTDSAEVARLLAQLNLLRGQVAGLINQINLLQSVVTSTVTNSNVEVQNLYTNLRDVAVEDVAVFAPQMRPSVTDGCDPEVTFEFAATQPNLVALPFLANVDTSADFTCMLPFSWAGRNFKIWVYWGHAGSGTAWDVAWEVTSNAAYDDEPLILDFLPGVLVEDTGGTPGNLYIAQSTAVPIASYENEPGSLVSLRITRRGTFTEDTMDITAYLLAVRFTLEDIPLVAPTLPSGELYLRFEGGFTDSSVAARTVTSVSSPALSSSHPGGGAQGMVGNGAGHLTVVDDGAFNIGTRIFQLRFHLYVTTAATLNTDNIICGKWGATDGSWFVNLYGPNGRLNWGTKAGTYFFDAITDAAIPRDTLVQVTIWRHTVSGTIFCALNGTTQTANVTRTPDTTTNNFAVGAVVGGGAALPAGVYIDELQFKIDTTDYPTSANFTPPTPPYT